MFNLAVVICSGFFHALWNVVSKHSKHKLAFFLCMQCMALVIFFPYVAMNLSPIVWNTTTYILIPSMMFFHALYFVFLARAYSLSDVSTVYPIVRGSMSLMLPIVGVFFLGEHITIMGWVGIAAIIIGIVLLSESAWSVSGLKKMITGHTGIALLVAVCSAANIMIDKFAISFFPIITVNWIGTLGNCVVLLLFIWDKETVRLEWQRNKGWIWISAILAPVSYLMFLWAIQSAQIAQLAPIREIGSVFAVGLGIAFLGEKNGRHRLIASLIVTAGIILLGLNR